MERVRVLTTICALIVVIASPLAARVAAQGTTGSISGFITDDTSGALPGATVTVRHVETDQRRTRQFDPGLFFIPGTRFGNISVSGLQPLGPDTNTPTFVDLKSLQIIDNLNWSRASHNVKAGFSLTHYMNDQDSSFDFGGNYAFASLENFIANRPNTFEGQAPGSTTARRWRQDLVGLYARLRRVGRALWARRAAAWGRCGGFGEGRAFDA